MAPTEELTDIAKRYLTCPSGYYYSGNSCYEYSSWYFWGRWVLAGVIVFFVCLMLVLLGCCNRRRRRRGLAPMYGTGWMGGNRYGRYPNQNYGAGPPPYGQSTVPPQYTGNTFQGGDGYYGQREGVLQQPENTYYPRGGENYGPPAGPPPSKIA